MAECSLITPYDQHLTKAHINHIRLLFFTDSPIFGGGEQYLVNLLKHLPNQEFTLACIGTHPATLAEIKLRVGDRPIDFIHYDLGPHPSVWKSVLPLARLIAGQKPAILHINGIDAYGGSYAALAGRVARAPAIVGSFHMSKEYPPFSLSENIFRSLVDHSFSGVIAVSDTVKERIITARKIPAARIIRIYNGIETSPKGEYPAWMNQSPQSMITIGTAGRFAPGKDFYTFVKAVRLLSDSYANLKFIIAGDGPDKEQLLQLAREQEVAKKILFLGWVNDIQSVLNQLDIFVLCSLNEGFPLSILEAMAAGLPVVASRVGGIPEMMLEGETGYLVPAGDEFQLKMALEKLINDPEQRQQLGKAGRERVIRWFSIDRMIAQTSRYYRDLLSVKF